MTAFTCIYSCSNRFSSDELKGETLITTHKKRLKSGSDAAPPPLLCAPTWPQMKKSFRQATGKQNHPVVMKYFNTPQCAAREKHSPYTPVHLFQPAHIIKIFSHFMQTVYVTLKSLLGNACGVIALLSKGSVAFV